MRVVICHGFTSSSVMDPTWTEGRNESPFTSDDFIGGAKIREQIEDADIIIGIWPPTDEAIVIKAPEGVAIETVTFPHARDPQHHPQSTTFEREFRS